MTGIEGVGWPIRPRAVSRAASRSGFTMPPEPGDPGQAAAVAETPAMSPASMLSLQELGGETVEDREARRHGHDMLAALGELQRALLAGGGDAEALQRSGGSVDFSAAGDRSTAGGHGLGDRRAGAGRAGATSALSGGEIVAWQIVEACSRALGAAIGRRYKPAQLRSRTGRGVPRLPTSPGRERSARKGRTGTP